jgi:hypothetical protein
MQITVALVPMLAYLKTKIPCSLNSRKAIAGSSSVLTFDRVQAAQGSQSSHPLQGLEVGV